MTQTMLKPSTPPFWTLCTNLYIGLRTYTLLKRVQLSGVVYTVALSLEEHIWMKLYLNWKDFAVKVVLFIKDKH